MSAASQPAPSAPRKFSPSKYFKHHRPAGVSIYSPLPIECWQMARNGPWNNYTLSRMEEKHLRAYMRLVPAEDQDGKSGRPMLTSEAGYGKLAKMTHSHRSTARRINRSLREKGYIVAWDVTTGNAAPKRKGQLRNVGEHKATRYLVRTYADVRTRMEANPKIGKQADPTNNGALHFFKLGRGARLLTPEEIESWDCEGYMQSKLEVKLAEEHRGLHVVPDQTAQTAEKGDGGGAPADPNSPAPLEIPPEITDLFREVSPTLNDMDIAGMYRDAMERAGPLGRGDLLVLLRAVVQAGGHTRGFKYLAKTLREKATGFGEGRAREAKKPKQKVDERPGRPYESATPEEIEAWEALE